jgi:hypothetical protein
MKMESLSFRKDVGPGEVATFKERLKGKGYVKEMTVRFYPGSEGSLQVNPYVLHKNEVRENVITYVEGTNQYLAGDDDRFIIPCYCEFTIDDNFVVYANNTGAYVYTLSVDVVIQYIEHEVF